VERWPEGKEALSADKMTPLSLFEAEARCELRISEKEKAGFIALLGGPYSEGNKD
jgi:hypothetical protein